MDQLRGNGLLAFIFLVFLYDTIPEVNSLIKLRIIVADSCSNGLSTSINKKTFSSVVTNSNSKKSALAPDDLQIVVAAESVVDLKERILDLQVENGKMHAQITHFRRNNRNLKRKLVGQEDLNKKINLTLLCEKDLNGHLVDVITMLRKGSK